VQANPLARHQVEINQSTADNWESYASHRKRVTELIESASAGSGGRLAVLGAGNCNDLDLKRLAAAYAQVDLFDLDASAMRCGLLRQSMRNSPEISIRRGVDFSGVLSRLAMSADKSNRELELAQLTRRAARTPRFGTRGGYDVVVSACVLSQIISSAVLALGVAEPVLPSLILELRKTHLRMLCGMAAPGGRVVFVSDLVSSDTCRDLLVSARDDIRPLMEAAVQAGNFFTGLNPFAILSRLPRNACDFELLDPWLWTLSGERAALVYAVTFKRR